MLKPIRTPRGRRMSVAQYLAFAAMRQSSRAGAPACEYGHFGCAAWEGGPCTDELLGEVETNEREQS